jgi:hypothetical protein
MHIVFQQLFHYFNTHITAFWKRPPNFKKNYCSAVENHREAAMSLLVTWIPIIAAKNVV